MRCSAFLILFGWTLAGTLLPGCKPKSETPSVPGMPDRSTSSRTHGAVSGNEHATGSKQITIETSDVKLTGDLYESAAPTKGVVLLLHQRGGSARDWTTLCEKLRDAGFRAFAMDLRGTGRSPMIHQTPGTEAPWETTGDIEAAGRKLSPKHPFAVIGASYGANNSLIYAAKDGDRVSCLVLLSPGVSYHGLDALSAAPDWKGPTYICTARGDEIAGDGPSRIAGLLPSGKTILKTVEGSGHGVELLDAKMMQDIGKFLADNEKH